MRFYPINVNLIFISNQKTGVSLKKRPILPTVYLDDCRNLDHALNQLKQKIYRENSTRWYKRRYGYFEKPSELKRKRRKMKQIVSRSQNNLWLKIDQQEQFSRTGKNAVGH